MGLLNNRNKRFLSESYGCNELLVYCQSFSNWTTSDFTMEKNLFLTMYYKNIFIMHEKFAEEKEYLRKHDSV